MFTDRIGTDIADTEGIYTNDLPQTLQFKSMVKYYSHCDLGQEIHSNGPEHSTYVFSQMLLKTKKEVFILLNGFTGEISENDVYISAMRNSLLRDIKFRALFINNPNQKSSAFNLLHQFPYLFNYKICSKEAKKYLSEIFKKYHTICNFATFDNDKYRLEIVPSKFISVSNFNDLEQTRDLRNIFKEAYKIS